MTLIENVNKIKNPKNLIEGKEAKASLWNATIAEILSVKMPQEETIAVGAEPKESHRWIHLCSPTLSIWKNKSSRKKKKENQSMWSSIWKITEAWYVYAMIEEEKPDKK